MHDLFPVNPLFLGRKFESSMVMADPATSNGNDYRKG